MADNVTITPGTGASIAADDIGGVLHQRVKISVGADGAAADLAPGQVAKTASLPVVLASDDDIQGKLGIVTEAAPASDTASSGLNGRLQRIAQRLTTMLTGTPAALGQGTMAASMKVVIASDQSAVAVNQATNGYSGVQLSITRPANTTPYTAGDVLGAAAAALTFPTMGPSAARVMITGASLQIDITDIPVGMTSFRLYMYSVTPPSALADNAVWDLPSGDRAAFAGMGYIDLGTPVDLGSTLYVQTDNINHPVKLAGTSIFAYLVTNGGFTPAANSEVYRVTLHTVAV